MSTWRHGVRSAHDDRKPEDQTVVIRPERHGLNMIDYLFWIVMPGDNEIPEPTPDDWRTLTSRIAADNDSH